MRIAVIGGGIFGCTIAAELADNGHRVHLFERSHQLLKAASGVNQFRLHQGYHYPRSPETARECQQATASFREVYSDAVIEGQTIYGIALQGSKTSPDQYLAFCNEQALPYRVKASGPFNRGALALTVSVSEPRIDPLALHMRIKKRLLPVMVHLGYPAYRDMRKDFDRIVIAAYASTNAVARELGCREDLYQFEVIEKPVVQLPESYRDLSMVVMDGEFASVDPYGRSGLHLLGHVKHAIHASNTGLEPEVPAHLVCNLNAGVVTKPAGSWWRRFIEAGAEFVPALSKAEHIGSMFTVRAVLPERDDTDERPTLVEALDDKVIRVFSGKIGTAVVAARKVREMVGEQQAVAA